MRRLPYFRQNDPCAPAPLSCSVARVCRFEEVDPLNVMWHGRYPSYFEDARAAFGERYGLSYADFYREKVALPLRQLHIDYLVPIRLAQEVRVEAKLHYCEAARLNFEYTVFSSQGDVLTTGCSVQLFCRMPEGELCLAPPDFYAAILQRWKNGEYSDSE